MNSSAFVHYNLVFIQWEILFEDTLNILIAARTTVCVREYTTYVTNLL